MRSPGPHQPPSHPYGPMPTSARRHRPQPYSCRAGCPHPAALCIARIAVVGGPYAWKSLRTGVTDCHSQFANWLRNDKTRTYSCHSEERSDVGIRILCRGAGCGHPALRIARKSKQTQFGPSGTPAPTHHSPIEHRMGRTTLSARLRRTVPGFQLFPSPLAFLPILRHTVLKHIHHQRSFQHGNRKAILRRCLSAGI